MAVSLEVPREIKFVMGRPAAPLSEESVGRYFRNDSEIADLEEVLAYHPEQTFAGLIEDRAVGRFSYNGIELLHKLFCLDAITGLSLPVGSRTKFLLHGYMPVDLKDTMNDLASVLKKLQAEVRSISDIDFNEFPDNLRKIVNQPKITSPADLFPPITVGLWQPTGREALASLRYHGNLSGANISLKFLHTAERYNPGSELHVIAQDQMCQFRPFEQAA